MNTPPHLWFPLLTHSQWKWALFIFQTACGITDPEKKAGETKEKRNRPRGIHSSQMWKRQTVKGSSLALCILHYREKNHRQESQSVHCWFYTKYLDTTVYFDFKLTILDVHLPQIFFFFFWLSHYHVYFISMFTTKNISDITLWRVRLKCPRESSNAQTPNPGRKCWLWKN